jgi:hypothetical protein
MRKPFFSLTVMLMTLVCFASSCDSSEEEVNNPEDNQGVADLLQGRWKIVKMNEGEPYENAEWLFNSCDLSASGKCTGKVFGEDEGDVISFDKEWTVENGGKVLKIDLDLGFMLEKSTLDIQQVTMNKLKVRDKDTNTTYELDKL